LDRPARGGRSARVVVLSVVCVLMVPAESELALVMQCIT
jgi:hypothetical protein